MSEAMRERLVLQRLLPTPLLVTSLTRVGAVATAITAIPHGYASNDSVLIANAVPAGYNTPFVGSPATVITVTGASSFTYPVDPGLTTPAAGSISVSYAGSYASDAQQGRSIGWTTIDTLPAELVALQAAVEAPPMAETYRFRVRTRPDLALESRVLWTPSWPNGAPLHTLQIKGIVPDTERLQDWRTFTFLDCAEAFPIGFAWMGNRA